ncbi:MAG: DNA-directed RNA polymerase subunit alpha [Microgenomates group bacterium]
MIEPNFTIQETKKEKNLSLFEIAPLPQGYGYTLGSALRRVLLTSLPGTAIVEVKISGVRHRFSTLEGLREDILEFLLNLKKVRFSYKGDKPLKLTLEKSGPGEIKAGDIKTPAEIEVVNKDLVLGYLADKKSKIKAELLVEKGVGYLSLEERTSDRIGVIPLDAIFSPVLKVNYHVEPTRVGRKTDFDKLTLEVLTDGTISPAEALKKSGEILVSFFNQIVKPKKPVNKEEDNNQIANSKDDSLLETPLEDFDLPLKVVNALKKAGYKKVKDLVKATPEQLLKIKNLGEKSVKEIEKVLAGKGLSLNKEK